MKTRILDAEWTEKRKEGKKRFDRMYIMSNRAGEKKIACMVDKASKDFMASLPILP
jgi:hypothetical protein